MAHEFHLPDIGEGLTEAVVVSWHVAVGDPVSLDEPLVEVETDKAVVDIPSPFAGVLLHRGAEAGDTLAVDALLAVVGEQGETWTPSSPLEAAAPIVGRLEEVATELRRADGSLEALPYVRRLAAELGVDLASVAGSGPRGRITEDDVRAAASVAAGPVRRERMSPTRRAIAQHLTRSWREIPHVTTYGEASARRLFEERDRAGGVPLEVLLIETVLPVLERFPDFNAALSGDEIVHKLFYDIGFAVDTPQGLVVAVVRDAAALDRARLTAEVLRLAAAAKSQQAEPSELRGQTFTISNIGAVGGRYGTPIIPYGTTAILSVGRAEERPVVRDGAIVVGRELPLSLSYDHRVIDGAKGRAFLTAVIDALAGP